MEARRLLAILRRRAPILVAAVIVGALAGYLTSSRTTTYRANALVYVGRPITSATTAADAYGPQVLASVLAPAVASAQVADRALAESHLPGSAGSVAAATIAGAIPGTSLIVISVADPNPARSEQLTNAVATAFTELAATLPPVLAAAGITATPTPATTSTSTTPPAGGSSTSTGTRSTTTTRAPSTTVPVATPTTTVPSAGAPELVALYRAALLPGSPLPTSTTRDAELGGLIGLAVAVLLVALIDLTGLRARGSRSLEQELGVPVLSVLPHCRDLAAAPSGTGDPAR